jgi:hypothetical protein
VNLGTYSAGVGFCGCLGTVCIELINHEQMKNKLETAWILNASPSTKVNLCGLGWPSPDPKLAFDLQAALVSQPLAVCLSDHDSSS